jgi:Spy/CpxP family protein refolding chaperone
MKFRLLLFTLLAGTLAIAPASRAQVPNETTLSDETHASQEQSIRKTLVQKIEQLKYDKIKKDLELDDVTADKFFAVYKPAEKEIQALVAERNFELKALGAATNTPNNEADIAAMTEKIKDLNQRIAAREQKLDGELVPLLTPLQRAKLLVFEHEFNQRVREQIAEHKGARAAQLRELRRLLRQQRIKNQLLKKKAAEKAAEHR